MLEIEDDQFAYDCQQRDQDDGTYLHHTVTSLGQHQQRAFELECNDDGEDRAEYGLEHTIIGRIKTGRKRACPLYTQ